MARTRSTSKSPGDQADKPRVNREKLFYEEFAEQVIEMLKSRKTPWPRRPELAGTTKTSDNVFNMAPRNPVSGTTYRGVNSLRLALTAQKNGWKDPRWMTFNQARAQGYRIKKGSKSTKVLYYEQRELSKESPQPDASQEQSGLQPPDPAADKEAGKDKEYQCPIAVLFNVFNAEQIDGIPPLELAEISYDWDPNEKAEQILQNSGAVIIHENIDGAYYSKRDDTIHLPNKEQYITASSYYSNALHELAHWTGAPARLNRQLANSFGDEAYAREELRAELASWMLGQEIGTQHDAEFHASYIDAWVKCLSDTPGEIKRACRDAEKIRKYIMEFARDKEQDKVQEQAQTLGKEANREQVLAGAEKAREGGKAAVKDHLGKEKSASAGQTDKPAQPSMEEARETSDPTNGLTMTGTTLVLPTKDAERLNEAIKQLKPESAAAREEHSMEEQGADNGQNVPSPDTSIAREKTYLYVPYKEKDKAKALGAKWDADKKLWYAPTGTDLKPLERWTFPLQSQVLIRKVHMPRETLDPRQEFAEKLAAMGLDLQGELPVMDGTIKRVPLLSKNGRGRDGAYCLYGDGRPAGWAQNYQTGEYNKLVATGYCLTPEEKERQRMEQARKLAEREAAQKKQHDYIAGIAQKSWEKFEPAAPDNPYLQQKGIELLPGVKEHSNNGFRVLCVPLYNTANEIRGMQYITPDNRKTFMPGMEKKGNFHLIGNEDKQDLSKTEIILCEGYATGASLHMATQKPVAVAFDAGNLEIVAEKLREKFPQAQIVICADNDHAVKRDGRVNNVGVERARLAAQSVGGKVVVPTFNKDEKAKGLTDFNDLHQSRGLEEVKRQVGKYLQREMSR